MSLVASQFSTNSSLTEMEALIRRVVKEAVRDEFTRVLRSAPAAIVADWAHEGPDDPVGDRLLLAEALTAREQYRTHPKEWTDWDAFKVELKAAEAAGELSD